jgi:hypothetical protein
MEPEMAIPANLKLHNAEKKAAWLSCLAAAAVVATTITGMTDWADALYAEYIKRCPPPS